jgi:NosR/NirI family nitrous oxide reductase transcriptional regulator
MRSAVAVAALVAGAIAVSHTQSAVDPKLQGQLKQLFPAAAAFSPKVVDPPHYKVFATNPGAAAGSTKVEPQQTGLVFWTTEIEPLERAYDGPIKMLVGMDTNGILTGIIVVQHHEPYGYFSIEKPEFAAQFKGKSIRDRFRVGEDVAAISTATITLTSAARAIRNSARRMATQLLVPPKP